MPYLRLSPNQNRAGLAMATVEKRHVTLVVLPKVWRENDRGKNYLHELLAAEGGREIVAYEGDYLQYDDTDTPLIKQLLKHATDPFDRKDRAGIVHGDDDDDDRVSPLLATSDRAPRMQVDRNGNQPSTIEAPRRDPEQKWPEQDHLLTLALLTKHLDDKGEREHVAPCADDGDPHYASGVDDQIQSPVLVLLRAKELVDMVAALLPQLRRGYREEEDSLSIPRGRIGAAAVIFHLETGLPRLHCRYDEFTDATPFFQALATTLDRLASGTSVAEPLASHPLASGVARDALKLRHAIGHISSLPVATAARVARTVRLGRLQRTWEGVRKHCVPILEDRPASKGTASDDGSTSMVWVINTAGLWEDLLAVGLRKVLDHRRAANTTEGEDTEFWVGNRKSDEEHWICTAPWLGLESASSSDHDGPAQPTQRKAETLGSKKRPDLLVHQPDVNRRWVIDAKYKVPRYENSTPSAPDQYQLFGYSHLTLVAKLAVTHAAVARPVWRGQPYPQNNPDLRSFHPRGSNAIPGQITIDPPLSPARPGLPPPEFNLHIWELPFPSAADVLDHDTWNAAITELADQLARALGVVSSESTTAPTISGQPDPLDIEATP